MARFRQIKNVFSSGELSPKLHKLAGLDEFQKGLAEQLNQISVGTGGSFSRSGTRFLDNIAPTGYGSERTAPITDPDCGYGYIPVETDATYSLCLEVRFHHPDRAENDLSTFIRLLDIDAAEEVRLVGGISYYSSASTDITYPGEEFPWSTLEKASDLQYIQIDNTIIMVHPSGKFKPFFVVLDYNEGIDKYPLIDVSSWGDAINSPDLFIRDLSAKHRVPYDNINRDTSVYLKNTVAITSGPTANYDIFVTDSAGNVQPAGTGTFEDEDIGRTIKVENVADNWGYSGYIVAVISGEQIQVRPTSLIGSPPANGFTNVYWMSSWGGSKRKYPRAISFYEERLILASTVYQPSTIWASKLGDYAFFNESRTLLNVDPNLIGAYQVDYQGEALTSDPFNIVPSDGGIVTWLNSQDKIYIGSYKGESIGGGVQFQFSNSQAFVKNQDNKGGIRVFTQKTNDGVVFVGRDGKTLLQFKYSDNGSHITRNLSLLADHLVFHNNKGSNLTDLQFIKLAWQSDIAVLWALTSDYQLLGITIDPDTNTLGWHKHSISTPENSTISILDMCIVRSRREDTLLLFIKREMEINGDSRKVYSLEKIGAEKPSISMNTGVELDTITDKYPVDNLLLQYFYTYPYADNTDNDIPWYMDGAIYMYLRIPSTRIYLRRAAIYPDNYPQWTTGTAYTRGDIVKNSLDGIEPVKAWVAIFDHTSAAIFADDVTGFLPKWFEVPGNIQPIHYRAGDSIDVIADGAYIGTKTIQIDTFDRKYIDLSVAASRVVVGHAFTKRIKTLPMNIGSQIGDSLEPIKRIDRVQVSVYNSKGGKYGSEDNDLKSLEYTGDTTTLESTDFIEAFPSSNDRLAQVILEEDRPLPMNILAISMRGVTHDG